MQVPSQSDFSYARSLDFNDFDDNEAFSSPEKSLIRSRTLNESSAKVYMASQRKEMQFSSIQMRECQIKIDTENDFESVQQMDNNLSMLSLSNQSSCKTMTGRNIISNENLFFSSEEKPPLPVKTRSRSLRLEQPRSMYDNVDDANRNSTDTKASTTSSTSSLTSTLSHTSRATENIADFQQSVVKNKYMSCIETGSSFGMSEHLQTINDDENPPPLPLKKKHSKYSKSRSFKP